MVDPVFTGPYRSWKKGSFKKDQKTKKLRHFSRESSCWCCSSWWHSTTWHPGNSPGKTWTGCALAERRSPHGSRRIRAIRRLSGVIFPEKNGAGYGTGFGTIWYNSSMSDNFHSSRVVDGSWWILMDLDVCLFLLFHFKEMKWTQMNTEKKLYDMWKQLADSPIPSQAIVPIKSRPHSDLNADS